MSGMPLSAQKSSLSTTSAGCVRGITGSPYWMKYGLERSPPAPPRSSQAIRHITSRSPAPAAVMTSGFVVLLAIARKLSRYAAYAGTSLG